MENKKTKLTISGNPKKSFKNFDTKSPKGKKTVFIDRQSTKNSNKNSFNKKLESIINYDNSKGLELELNFFNGYMHEFPKLFTKKLINLLAKSS